MESMDLSSATRSAYRRFVLALSPNDTAKKSWSLLSELGMMQSKVAERPS